PFNKIAPIEWLWPCGPTRSRKLIALQTHRALAIPSIMEFAVAIGTSEKCQSPSFCWFDVLIHSKQIRWVISLFDLRKSIIVFAIRSPNAIVSFLHHEVNVSPPRGMGMQGVPVVLCPCGDFFFIRRIGINADHHLGPLRVAIEPRRIAILD